MDISNGEAFNVFVLKTVTSIFQYNVVAPLNLYTFYCINININVIFQLRKISSAKKYDLLYK